MEAIIHELEVAEEFLVSQVAPRANLIDGDLEELRIALKGLRDRKLMALRRPVEFGGPELDETSFRMFQESVARRSGSLAFLQTQHQSAVSMIAKWGSDELKQDYLPRMADEHLVGIGFSQLRRPGEPIMRAREVDGGYRLDGLVPWVTGHSFYQEFLIGAALPSGESVFGIVPFIDSEQHGGAITFQGPMQLAAMESPQTMEATLTNWLLPADQVAFVKPAGWLANNDMINVTLQAWFALGCARAGLDIVHQAYGHRGALFIHEAWVALDEELGRCREKILENEEDLESRLRARAWAIDLAARCAHAGVVASSGAANSIHHAAQRVYREALVYTVSAQTRDIMEASLNRLVSRGTV
jgi:alkylation response protein AidB-like acyl-CoA dehydrogenase